MEMMMMNDDSFDNFFDNEDTAFLENLEKAKEPEVVEVSPKVQKASGLLKDLKLDAKDIEKYKDRQVTFATLQENMELWQHYFDKVKDIPDDIIQVLEDLDLSIPNVDDLELASCFEAYYRISDAQTMIYRYINKVNTKHKYLDMARKDFASQAFTLMPGKLADEKTGKANDLVFKYTLALVEIETIKESLEQYKWIVKSRLESLDQIVYAIISERKQNVNWKDEHVTNTQSYNKL